MRADLLAKLQSGATLVTPNTRLAQHFKQRYDQAQADAGLAVWPTPDVLPWTAFAARCFEEIAFHAPKAPLLLSQDQESVLWEAAIERAAVEAGLLSPSQTVAQCMSAWSLAHAWHLWPRMKNVPLSDDARAFVSWAEAYEVLARRGDYLDDARLAAWVGEHLADPHWRRPAHIVLAGFDIEPPAQQTLLEAFERAGSQVERGERDSIAGAAMRVSCPTPQEELDAVAHWARARLRANPSARIGIVLPDLTARRGAVLRAFHEVLMPSDRAGIAVNVSAGVPLSDWPLVHDALSVLEAARGRPRAYREWSAMLLSPFFGGARAEHMHRARLDAALRESCSAEETLEGLQRAVVLEGQSGTCPALGSRLAKYVEAVRGAGALRAAPSAWGKRFAEWLAIMGFPGDRTLDSIEHQTLKKFRDLLESLSALDRVSPRVTLNDALGRLRRSAADALFQPEISALPIQALGILESAGTAFDHLWVTGLTTDAWPLAARPNPFLPVSLQRQAGIPEASASASLEVDRRITEGWLGAASEVVFSHPRQDGDRELSVSPLVSRIPLVELETVVPKSAPAWRESIFAARARESVLDDTAPEFVATVPLSSGVAALQDQAACPFRAQARHRLHARSLRSLEPGLDAAQRGTLIHAVLQRVWAVLKDQDGLFNRDEAALAAEVGHAVADVLAHSRAARLLKIQPRLAAVEAARLERLVLLWLEVEKERAPFAVEFVEDKRVVNAGRLPLSVKLDRMDRILIGDLAGGGMVIDYKTGRANVSAWEGERPDEPQLPLYLLASEEDIAALAFAQVRVGEMGLKGLARAGGSARGVGAPAALEGESDAAAWERNVREWRRNVAALGDAFVAGMARVDPKHGTLTCSRCDLHMLCRIADDYAEAEGGDE
jgi:ATP-dependent helicase/nuclease subunit B